MADKVQLIKEEIERLYNLYELANDYQRMGACSTILSFIDSLPEESGCEVNFTTKSEDLEEEIENYIKDSLAIKFPTTDKEQIKADIRYIAYHFAEWGKTHK